MQPSVPAGGRAVEASNPALAVVLGEGAHSHDGDGVVVKDSRDIFRGELVGGVADQKAGLADRTVADDNAPAKRRRFVSKLSCQRRQAE